MAHALCTLFGEEHLRFSSPARAEMGVPHPLFPSNPVNMLLARSSPLDTLRARTRTPLRPHECPNAVAWLQASWPRG